MKNDAANFILDHFVQWLTAILIVIFYPIIFVLMLVVPYGFLAIIPNFRYSDKKKFYRYFLPAIVAAYLNNRWKYREKKNVDR